MNKIIKYGYVFSLIGMLFLMAHSIAPHSHEVINSKETIQQEGRSSIEDFLFSILTIELEDVSPNPINFSRELTFSNSYDGTVVIDLIDVFGNVVKKYVNSFQNKGTHSFVLSIDDISSGKYMLRLQHADRIISKQVMIIK